MFKYTLALAGLFFFLGISVPHLSLAEEEDSTSEQMEGDLDSALSNMDIDPTNSLADPAEEQGAPNPEE